MEEKTKKKMKICSKIWLLIFILLALLTIPIFIKFKIIRDIDKQYEKDRQSENFYQRTIKMGTRSEMTETFIYGDKSILKTTYYDEEGKEERSIYIDQNQKENWIIIQTENKKEAVKLEYQEDFKVVNVVSPTGIESKDMGRELLRAITTPIKKGKWATKDCYEIRWGEETTSWIDKEDMRMIGERNGYTSGTQGYPIDNITTYYYKENQLTEKDVQLPDLTQYVIKDAQGNEKENGVV